MKKYHYIKKIIRRKLLKLVIKTLTPGVISTTSSQWWGSSSQGWGYAHRSGFSINLHLTAIMFKESLLIFYYPMLSLYDDNDAVKNREFGEFWLIIFKKFLQLNMFLIARFIDAKICFIWNYLVMLIRHYLLFMS
jgi:hypothetical protein